MQLSDKQAAYWRDATRTYNIKSGATRSGKTYIDYYVIPRRVRECAGREGAIVLIGNTRGTLQRNIVDPLISIWGADLVSPIRADNTVGMFGARAYCLGADNAKHINRLRGMSIAYAYGDELTTWAQGVFDMLKSRLDKPYSRFDGTCNPDAPGHWVKRFLDSSADLYHQDYTLDDNPFLDPLVSARIKRGYAGTVYYDRYVLGKWVAAEGVIYRQFADDPARYTGVPGDGEIRHAWIGVDFGGNGSAHAFCVLGADARYTRLYVLDEYYRREIIDPETLARDYCDFALGAASRWAIDGVYADSAETTLIRGLNAALMRMRRGASAETASRIARCEVRNARKDEILGRVRFVNTMIARDAFRIAPHCKHTADALATALWDAKHTTKDVRLDDGTTNIDSLDALEYAVERVMKDFLR